MPISHPAWGARFFAWAGTLLCWVALAVNSATKGYRPSAAWTAVFILCAAGAFELLVSARWSAWRPWMTHGGVLLGESSLVLLVLANGHSPTGAVACASMFTWTAAFAGLYLGPRAVLAHVVLLNTLVLLVLIRVIGFPAAAAATVIVAQASAGVAGLCVCIAGSLRRQGEEDALTGLLNRRGLFHRMEQRNRPKQAEWSVVILDLDGFKILNDTQGHEAGDAVLVQASALWTGLLGPGDLLARTGGDEFVLIHPGPIADGERMANRLREVVRQVVEVSAGVASWSGGIDLDQVLREADAAMYRDKQGARSRAGGAPTAQEAAVKRAR